jgi:cytochrome c-type biogenesis protein CcmH/NrfG
MAEDVQQQILDELRNQTAMFRKVNKINIIALCIFLFVIAIIMTLTPFIQRISRSFPTPPQRADSWQEARSFLDQGEHQRAQEMLQRLIKKHPDFYYGYAVLGSLHQELGNAKEAEVNHAKAYDLFPTEENKKTLTAIRMVLEKNKTANK